MFRFISSIRKREAFPKGQLIDAFFMIVPQDKAKHVVKHERKLRVALGRKADLDTMKKKPRTGAQPLDNTQALTAFKGVSRELLHKR